MQILVTKQVVGRATIEKLHGADVIININNIILVRKSNINYGDALKSSDICSVSTSDYGTFDIIIDFDTLVQAMAGNQSCRVIYNEDDQVIRTNFFTSERT